MVYVCVYVCIHRNTYDTLLNVCLKGKPAAPLTALGLSEACDAHAFETLYQS